MKFKEQDDEVVSLSILHGGSATPEERDTYLKLAPWKADENAAALSEDHQAMADEEQFILTVCANGYGKISSAYEYRRAGRGGMGITNIDNIKRNGPVVASFTATKADQLLLVTDQAVLALILELHCKLAIGRDVGEAVHAVAANIAQCRGEDDIQSALSLIHI